MSNGWLTGKDVFPAAVQRVIRPAVKLMCPWILVRPSKSIQTMLFAATAPHAEVGLSSRHAHDESSLSLWRCLALAVHAEMPCMGSSLSAVHAIMQVRGCCLQDGLHEFRRLKNMTRASAVLT